MTATVDYTTPRCGHCGEASVVSLGAAAFAAWRAGAYVQTAFPAMPAPERETLITGTHPACWDAMFAGMDEE